MISIFRSFLPWIIFSILYGSTRNSFVMASLVALGYLVIFEWKDLKEKMIFTWVTLCYFLMTLFLSYIFTSNWIEVNSSILSNFALMCIAFGSLIAKVPFTIQYARRTVEPQKWKHPLFIEINNILTAMWGVLFLLALITNITYSFTSELNHNAYLILTNFIWIIGAIVSKWFPSYWRKRNYEQNHPIKKSKKSIS